MGRKVRLGDVAQLRNGAGIKQQFFSQESDAVPLVKVSNFTGNSIDSADLTLIEAQEAGRWKSHVLEANDVLIATVGSWPPNWSSVVGKTIKVPKHASGFIQNQNTCCILPSDRLNKGYLYYRLRGTDFSHWIVNVAQGSANQARVPVKNIAAFQFQLPSLHEQKAIAHILGTLDDKIELNRQTNQTLEAMAQALFKSWFVDFDPVIDNALAAGKAIPKALQPRAEIRAQQRAQGHAENAQPASASDYHQLFPDEFTFTEQLGWIPKGWDVFAVGETLNRLKVPKRYKKKDVVPHGNYPVLEQGADIYLGYVTEAPTFEASIKHPKFIFGDHTCVMELAVEPFCVSENVIVLEGAQSTLWAFYATLGLQKFEEYRRHWMEFAIKELVVPEQNLQEGFSQFVEPLVKKKNKLRNQNKVIERLRDTLLPKLISGELRIPDAEKLLAEAGL